MTEYWKSQAKKFCQYCKVWITDNKASVGFHEGGKKHQLAVQNRLKEICRKGIEDSRNSRSEAAMLQQMEENALNSYRTQDLTSNADITASIFNKRRAEMRENRHLAEGINDEMSKAEMAQALSEESPSIGPSLPKSLQCVEAPKSGTKWHKSEATKGGLKLWYEAQSDEGHTYYWHVESNESRWDPPPEGYLSIAEQHDINRKSEAKTLHRNASIMASQSIHGRGEEIRAAAAETGQEPIYDPYGGWQTVTPKPAASSSEIDYEAPVAKAPVTSSVTLHSERDRYNFKEKTVSSQSTEEVSKPKISFRKRKVDSDDKKRHIRQRESND
eukprot:TRINITY_DN2809_c0_g1_i1.p1 TRINITY_DN2809_c0_g1~~TRINITY_DN2809_c0_g1_i1.p1  ORF type:complete len:329 (-),score=87.29 TRINITY_DN2809_c0_g1_i1:148-1134(-)